MDKEVVETLKWEKLICDMINKGNYSSAYILIGEKLRQQVKQYPSIEDKRTEGIN